MERRQAGKQKGRKATRPFFSAVLPCCLAALPLLGTGCHRAHAMPQPVPLPQEPARTAAPRLRPAPVREPRPEQPKPEPPKAEATPVEPPKPEEPPKPPTLLQTTPANTEVDLERGIRATLKRAQTDLNRVDARRLNADARTQYDTAKSFIRQAEAAVREKNLVFAKTVADKAAGLAAQLAPK